MEAGNGWVGLRGRQTVEHVLLVAVKNTNKRKN